jgi:hypothetical protein
MAKSERFTSPAGIAKFPRLNEPDTKFKAEGEYKVTLVLTEEEANSILEKAKAPFEAFKAEEAKKLKKGQKLKEADLPVKDHYEGEELVEGMKEVTFKTKASGVSKKTGKAWEMKPALFDAKGKPLVPRPNVGGGSKLKVSYSIGCYNTPAAGCGVSLRLEAVQVLDLKEFGGGDAKSYGFGEEEGYEGSAPSENEGFNDAGEEADKDAPGGADY